ncbi:MAG TPA: hypothetical protein VGI10_05780 [Polyangiaceae bacterium]
MTRSGLVALCACCALCGCAKFQQAKECGAFVKTVNAWLAQGTTDPKAPSNDPTTLASDSRALAARYEDLSSKLAALHVASDDLLPRVTRYQQIAGDAAQALRQTADALDHHDLETARQKRIDFDTVARREGPLVTEINGLCR